MSQQQPPQGYGPPPGWQQPPQGYYPQQPPPPQKTAWYHSGVIVAVSLLFCAPIGLILLWTAPKTTMGTKVAATVLIGGFWVFAMTRPSTSTPSRSIAASPDSPAAVGAPRQAAASPAPARQMVTESCLELSQQFGTTSKLSDLQKEELWKAYEGKGFTWKLRITEVSSGVLGGYTVQAKCAPKSPSFIQDVQLSFDNDAKPFVMKLQKDEVYTMTGTLKHSSTLLGLTADGIPE